MPLVTPTLPSQGESADADDVSQPILDLLAVFNGHIGTDNLEPGTVSASIGNNEITADKIAANAVTTVKVADGSITPPKVAAAVVVTSATAGSITPVVSTRMYIVSALAEAATIAAPSGTPAEGQALTLRIKDNGTARALAWNAIYREIGLTKPGATVAGKELYVGLVYNNVATKWDIVSLTRQA